MTELDNIHDATDRNDSQAQLQAFLLSIKEITHRHARQLGRSIFDFDEDDQQVEIDRLYPYVNFEFSQNPSLKGLPLTISGDGLMFVSDKVTGSVLGAERISDGDIVTGRLSEVCVLPVPTIECLLLGDESETPVVDQVLSPMLLLEAAVYKTGYRNAEQDFQIEHNLDIFQIGLPLEHCLRVVPE